MSVPASNSPTGAVFLSYAHEDTDAARRIADALRACGVEVWFDQSELRGGDAWDQNIRKQIKDCALFLPVVSANTQARREGYFRLEWKLADDRTHLMAKGTRFILPVCVDDTKDWDAIVPDAFMTVQWTRLPGGETPAKFCERVKALLAGEVAPVSDRRFGAGATTGAGQRPALPRKRDRWPWLVPAGVGVAAVAAFLIYRSSRPSANPPAVVAPLGAAQSAAPTPAAPAPSPGVALANRARALYDKVGFTRDDLAPAEDFARRATEREPDSAAAWGVRAGVQSAWLFRNWDLSEKRLQDTQAFANHALALDPNEPEALLALGVVLREQGALEQAAAHLRRAVAANPNHVRLARGLGYTLGFLAGHEAEARAVLQEIARRAPRDPLVHYELALSYGNYSGGGGAPENTTAALEQLDAAIAIQPFSSALILKATLIGGWRGNLPAMRAVLDEQDKRPLAERSEDRSVCVTMWAGLIEHRPDRVEAAAALTARNYIDDAVMPLRPKAWSLALAHRLAGKENLARNDWQAAEAVLRQRAKDDPANPNYQVELAITLAWLERRDEAARLVAPIEAVWKEESSRGGPRLLARYYAAMGDAAKAASYLPQVIDQSPFTSRKVMPLDPWWDKLRGQPEFEALLKASPPK